MDVINLCRVVYQEELEKIELSSQTHIFFNSCKELSQIYFILTLMEDQNYGNSKTHLIYFVTHQIMLLNTRVTAMKTNLMLQQYELYPIEGIRFFFNIYIKFCNMVETNFITNTSKQNLFGTIIQECIKSAL